MQYMLDTNMLSHLVRQPRGAVAQWIRRVGFQNVTVSIFVAAEAKTWMAKGAARRLAEQFETIMKHVRVEPFEQPGDTIYAELRAELERSGQPIGANDMWIAAHALALDCTLVTANEREFRRVPRLRVENWLA